MTHKFIFKLQLFTLALGMLAITIVLAATTNLVLATWLAFIASVTLVGVSWLNVVWRDLGMIVYEMGD